VFEARLGFKILTEVLNSCFLPLQTNSRIACRSAYESSLRQSPYRPMLCSLDAQSVVIHEIFSWYGVTSHNTVKLTSKVVQAVGHMAARSKA
jgi:hypothetical protein